MDVMNTLDSSAPESAATAEPEIEEPEPDADDERGGGFAATLLRKEHGDQPPGLAYTLTRARGIIAAGGQWESDSGPWRGFVSAHLESDGERNWRVNQSFVVGAVAGEARRVIIALRYARGNRFEGQFWTVPERRLGLELQLLGGFGL